MKRYPSISAEVVYSHQIYAFDKLDGSNIRAEWSGKRGFYKFGARKRLLGEDEKILGRAIPIINDKYASDLEYIFKKQRWNKAICFFEFYGPNSFAGYHKYNEEQTVTLFDVAPDKKGLLEPKDFLKIFGHLDTAALLYRGKANHDFIKSVKERTLPGMTYEGVVCKGKHKSPGLPLMFKIKSNDWHQALRDNYQENKKLLEELL